MRRTLLALLFLGACSVGEVKTGGSGPGPDAGAGGNPTATASFNQMVAPLVTRCTACHSTAQPPNLSSFDALQPKYKMKPGAQNILVTKGSLTAGVHQGVQYLSAADQATVASWIDSL